MKEGLISNQKTVRGKERKRARAEEVRDPESDLQRF